MYDIYTIQSGDTIDIIANRLNTSPSVISRLNGISVDTTLTPGMYLVVPKMQNPYFDYYKVKQGDSLYQIARDNNIDFKILAEVNGLDLNDYIYPNQMIMIPKDNVRYYITSENDTLMDLSNKLGTNLNNILSQNDKILILPGQLIVFRTN